MANYIKKQSEVKRTASASLSRSSLSGCFSKVQKTTASRPVELRGPFLKTQSKNF